MSHLSRDLAYAAPIVYEHNHHEIFDTASAGKLAPLAYKIASDATVVGLPTIAAC